MNARALHSWRAQLAELFRPQLRSLERMRLRLKYRHTLAALEALLDDANGSAKLTAQQHAAIAHKHAELLNIIDQLERWPQ
jgi:hypothetical protein